jgi:hypothetical protein
MRRATGVFQLADETYFFCLYYILFSDSVFIVLGMFEEDRALECLSESGTSLSYTPFILLLRSCC